MKKVISILVASILSISALASCAKPAAQPQISSDTTVAESSSTVASTPASAPATDRVVTFWIQKYGSDPAAQNDMLKKMTDDFYAQSGIKVEYSIVDWGQALTKYTLACTGGEAPDVADIFFTASLKQIGGDKFGPMIVDDLATEMGVDTWFDAGKTEVFIDEHWYGIPWRMDTRVLLYNTEHFEKAGIAAPPTTWDEMLKTAEKLTVKDGENITQAGLAWFNMMARFDQTWFALLAGAGGSVMNNTYTEATYNTQEAVRSLDMLRKVVGTVASKNTVDPTYDPIAEFMAGKVSMVFGVTAETKNNIENQAPQMKGKFASAVMPSESGSGNSSIASSAPISVFKTAKDPEAAKEWVKFFCNQENQLEASKTLSLLNSRKDVMTDVYFSSNDWLKQFSLQADRAAPLDLPIASWSQVDAWPNGPLPTLCTDVMSGMDIQKALDKSISEYKVIIEQK